MSRSMCSRRSARSTVTLGGILLGAILAAAPGCGGNVITGGGGDGGGGGSTTTSTTGTTSTTTPTGTGCQSHDDCPGGLCIFSTGVCSTPCQQFDPCPTGIVCDLCATSSCSACDDCKAACVPAQPGQCDDHDDCPSGDVCVYSSGTCAPACTDMQGCTDPNLVCDPCATSACPMCESCLGACLESF